MKSREDAGEKRRITPKGHLALLKESFGRWDFLTKTRSSSCRQERPPGNKNVLAGWGKPPKMPQRHEGTKPHQVNNHGLTLCAPSCLRAFVAFSELKVALGSARAIIRRGANPAWRLRNGRGRRFHLVLLFRVRQRGKLVPSTAGAPTARTIPDVHRVFHRTRGKQ